MTFIVSNPISVDDERVEDLLCTAIESGSTYWYRDLHIIEDVDVKKDLTHQRYYVVPVHGGVLGMTTLDDSTLLTLNRSGIESGLDLMKADYPRHFDDFMEENDDAETADVFLQLCLFGEVVYG